uniref:HMG box domain-containing protein n=1 Tax=Athene cunicularia TaxID=194338 RepID=A0A663MY25_ATHCN
CCALNGAKRRLRKRQRRRPRKSGRLTTTKKPLSPFFLFMAQHRLELQKSKPHWTAVETAMKLGKMWHKQPEDDKEMYKKEAARLRRENKGEKHRSGHEPETTKKRAHRQNNTQAKRRKLRL